MLSLLFAMSVSISPVTPSEFIGPCPVVLKFNVTITSDKPVSGTYQLQNPLNAFAPEPFALTAAGSKTFPHQIKAGGPYGLHSWFEAKIVTPVALTSNRSHYRVACGPLAMLVVAHPDTYIGPCPATMKVRAQVYSDKAQTITYRWTRSDGILMPTKSLTFAAPGVQTLFTTWTTSKSGWMAFKLLSPLPPILGLAKAEFKMTCAGTATPG